MLKRTFIILILSFFPLFAWALHGQVADGVYRNSASGFQVNVPQNINYIDDTREIVFEANKNDWKKSGRYSIIWLSCKDAKKCPSMDDKTFSDFAPQGAQAIIKNLNNAYTLPVNLTFDSGKFVTINGKTAYQFIGKGTAQNVPAVWIETDINYKNAIGMAILLQPVDNSKPLDTQINWAQYNAFVDSLKKLN